MTLHIKILKSYNIGEIVDKRNFQTPETAEESHKQNKIGEVLARHDETKFSHKRMRIENKNLKSSLYPYL